MHSNSSAPVIRLRGVRHNNLKNFDLDLPVGRLIVCTGLSGSGKSSLAFDTLFAEGQRRYIETFSPYARQFFDRMDKPKVDRIEGIPPAIAVEQSNSVRTTRSTVGTMTELCDYMKVLWPHLAQLHCRQCHAPVRRESPQWIWTAWRPDSLPDRDSHRIPHARPASTSSDAFHESARPYRTAKPGHLLVTFDLPLSDKLSLGESLSLIQRQGYRRIWWDGAVRRIEEATPLLLQQSVPPPSLTIVQDRLALQPDQRARFIEACEQAYHFGKGKLSVRPAFSNGEDTSAIRYSKGLHCPACDLDYPEPTPALFSFNHPLGACPACRGFGRIITIDYDLALPDRSKSLAGGVVKPWQTLQGEECQRDLMKCCRRLKVPTDVPFLSLPRHWQDWVIHGDKDYGSDARHRRPHAWYGVKGYFRWLESKSYKMHVRVLLSRYRAYTPCPDCRGARFQPQTLLYLAADPTTQTEAPAPMTLADFYRQPIHRALAMIEGWTRLLTSNRTDPVRVALHEIQARLGYLDQVGLGYLTLDRPTRSLSGGETQRVNLTSCLGSRMVQTLFVLDEPSVGLHPRDTGRLVRILEQLRDAGNTVVVVEHEASVMAAADQIVDLGPAQGEAGGHIVFQGSFQDLRRSTQSITGRYLAGLETAVQRASRTVTDRTPRLQVREATLHNLRNLAVDIPLGRLVCLTGVSGSGKSTLARDILLPALTRKLAHAPAPAHADADPARQSKATETGEDPPKDDSDEEASVTTSARLILPPEARLSRVLAVDQSSLGRTPRSNPAVYVGAFDHLRELWARTDDARRLGLNASAFSFNSAQGQCERCRGAGFERIEMQFLSDVFIRCPDCNGRRYRPHILNLKLPVAAGGAGGKGAWSIADLLEATVDDAMRALTPYAGAPAGGRALRALRPLQEIGLGYLRLGQPINTLSGGESQRLKLASHLTSASASPTDAHPEPALFIFDEPTTGLHFHDVAILLRAFQRLVDAGHSLLVIEHNVDVIRSADWILDLGPEGGEEGGRMVVAGTPETVMACSASHTGRALRGGGSKTGPKIS